MPQKLSEYLSSVPESYHAALRSALSPLGLPSALLQPLAPQPSAGLRDAARALAAAAEERPRLSRAEVRSLLRCLCLFCVPLCTVRCLSLSAVLRTPLRMRIRPLPAPPPHLPCASLGPVSHAAPRQLLRAMDRAGFVEPGLAPGVAPPTPVLSALKPVRACGPGQGAEHVCEERVPVWLASRGGGVAAVRSRRLAAVQPSDPHCLTVADMSNFAATLRKQERLRNPFADDEVRLRDLNLAFPLAQRLFMACIAACPCLAWLVLSLCLYIAALNQSRSCRSCAVRTLAAVSVRIVSNVVLLCRPERSRT